MHHNWLNHPTPHSSPADTLRRYTEKLDGAFLGYGEGALPKALHQLTFGERFSQPIPGVGEEDGHENGVV